MATRSRFDTHEVFNQSPPYENIDLFASDAPLAGRRQGEWRGCGAVRARRLRQAMGHRRYVRAWPARQRKSAEAARLSTPRAFAAIPSSSIRPTTASCAKASRPGCMLRLGRRPATRAPAPAEVVRAARFYMAAQVETGHLCPITMTRARLRRLPPSRRLPPRSCRRSSRAIMTRCSGHGAKNRGMTLGMGMTEKQGGTDVRANTTTATPRGDAYSIVGHKWFFSAPMSDAFLVLGAGARRPHVLSAAALSARTARSTRSAFNGLKDKLGNRSNASSEVEFTDAFAWRVGDEGAGIRTILQMVQLTRLDCADRLGRPDAHGAGAGRASLPLSQRFRQARFTTSR